jgi:hypothetical protein
MLKRRKMVVNDEWRSAAGKLNDIRVLGIFFVGIFFQNYEKYPNYAIK